jgi:hypothetical protein
MSQPTDDLTRSELRAIGGAYRGGSGGRRGSRWPRSSKVHVLARERDRAGSGRLR